MIASIYILMAMVYHANVRRILFNAINFHEVPASGQNWPWYNIIQMHGCIILMIIIVYHHVQCTQQQMVVCLPYLYYCNLGAIVISAVWPFMVFFPSKYSAKRRRNSFQGRLVITVACGTRYQNLITKRHSNISAIRHQSEFLMLII